MNTLRIVSHEAIAQKTKDVRYNDFRTSGWLGESQRWQWEGGDALVVVTGRLPNVTCYTVIRVGNSVHVLEGSLNQALRSLGYNPEKDFTVA